MKLENWLRLIPLILIVIGVISLIYLINQLSSQGALCLKDPTAFYLNNTNLK